MKRMAALLLALVLALMLAPVLLQVAGDKPDMLLHAAVRANLADSGVGHPVTAVLLNFRAWDTLLEIAVLLVAGVAGMSRGSAVPLARAGLRCDAQLLAALARWLVPFMLLLSAWLLWAGGFRSGGAFQAGAVLAAAGVLMRLAGIPIPFMAGAHWLRTGLVTGFSVFLLVALAGVPDGRPLLAYPPAFAGALILLVETTLTLSIAMVLLGLFVSAAPDRDPEKRDSP